MSPNPWPWLGWGLGILLSCSACQAPRVLPAPPPEMPAHVSAVQPGSGWLDLGPVGLWAANSKGPTAFFVNTYAFPEGPAPGIWHTVDVRTLGVPPEARAIFVAGILIITHGMTPEICNLTVTFRAAGDTLPASAYIMQTLAASLPDGPRTNAASFVPVHEGHFEVQWNRSPREGGYPLSCAYGINLNTQLYIRAQEIPRLGEP